MTHAERAKAQIEKANADLAYLSARDGAKATLRAATELMHTLIKKRDTGALIAFEALVQDACESSTQAHADAKPEAAVQS